MIERKITHWVGEAFIATLSESLSSMSSLWLIAGARLKIETEREDDGRWIAELPDFTGAMAYGDTRENAVANVQALAFRIAAVTGRRRLGGFAGEFLKKAHLGLERVALRFVR